VKYTGKYGPLHLGALYQFSGASGSANTAVQAQIGGTSPAGSVDGYYAKKKDAIATAPLSAAQVSGWPRCATPPSPAGQPQWGAVLLLEQFPRATISDNTTYGLMGSYTVGMVKFSAGYEHIAFDNPSSPLAQGSLTIGGYVLAYVNNTAFNNQKTLQVFWPGRRSA